MNPVTVWPEKTPGNYLVLAAHRAKNFPNKQEELELLSDEQRPDLLGFIKESGRAKSADWEGRIDGDIIFRKD